MLPFCSKEKLALVKGKTAALSFRGDRGEYSVKISSFYSKPIGNNTDSDFRGSKPGWDGDRGGFKNKHPQNFPFVKLSWKIPIGVSIK